MQLKLLDTNTKPSCITTDNAGEFLREAMKQGYVVTKLVKVLLVGPAGVGKTCLLYLLLSKDPPDQRTSTGCAERSIRVIRIGKESGEWSEIPTKEFEELIAEAVPVLYEELKAKNIRMQDLEEVLSQVVGDDKEDAVREGAVEREDIIVPGEEVIECKKGREGANVKERLKEKTGKPNETIVGDEERTGTINKVIQKLTELVSGGKRSRRLLDMELIYLTDCGGQQAYWDLVPIFTRDTSTTLFVHRLCEKLDEHPLNVLYQRGKQVGPNQRATLTTAQAFKTMLRGLHEGQKRSKIISVGTHRDLVSDCEETPEEKNKMFAAISSPYFKDDIVYCNEGLGDIVFQVNTKNPDGADKKEASKIRDCIMKGAKQHEIPIWWFILQLILEALALKLGRAVLSMEEVIHVSNTLGFSVEELDAALTFFDKLNIFLYKKTILPDIVFTDTQVPLGKLSKLVEKQYHLRAAMANPTKAADNAMTGDWQKFRDNGILILEFLEEFKEHYVEGLFTARDFLILLEKLMVISRLPNDEYFFPAILNMTSEDTIKEFLESCKRTKIAALVVEFPTGWAPPGVYCCSVCHLQSHSGWQVVKKSPVEPKNLSKPNALPGLQNPPINPQINKLGTSYAQVSRNCIKFAKVCRPGSMTFIDNFSFFAVCVNLDASKMEHDVLIEHCQDIKREVFAAVEAALENTHHEDTQPNIVFLCPRQNESCSTKLHVANLSSYGKQWICSENSEVFDNLTPEQTIWLGRSGKL